MEITIAQELKEISVTDFGNASTAKKSAILAKRGKPYQMFAIAEDSEHDAVYVYSSGKGARGSILSVERPLIDVFDQDVKFTPFRNGHGTLRIYAFDSIVPGYPVKRAPLKVEAYGLTSGAAADPKYLGTGNRINVMGRKRCTFSIANRDNADTLNYCIIANIVVNTGTNVQTTQEQIFPLAGWQALAPLAEETWSSDLAWESLVIKYEGAAGAVTPIDMVFQATD